MTYFEVDRPGPTTRHERARRMIERIEKRVGLSRLASIDPLFDRATLLASGDAPALARIAAARVSLERQRGNDDRALVLAREALAELDDGDVALALDLHVQMGRSLLSAGNTAQALTEGMSILARAKTIADERRRRGVTVEAWRLLACAYLNLEQLEQAIELCERGIDAARVDGNRILEGEAEDCMACAYGSMADQRAMEGRDADASQLLERSVACAQRAMRCARQAGHRYNEASALANIAERLVQGGRPEEALALMETWPQDGLAELTLIESHHFDVRGSICLALRRYDEAIAFFERALDTAKQSNLALAACEHLADAHERIGDFERALKYHKRFHALHKQVASEAAYRTASTAATYLKTRDAISRADHHRKVAEELRNSNDQLSRHAEELAVLSRHDSLTGLANRRVMEEIMAGEPDGLGVVMIDVDHFKSINDRWSHMLGDAVLRQVATLIKNCCRDVDTPVRYGGDEFAVLLREADERRTFLVADRIRELIHAFDWNSLEPDLSVSVSVGFAVASAGEVAGAIMAAADRRLLDAKEGGRNRVGGNVDFHGSRSGRPEDRVD